jgi:putative hydrolase of the HAD superfamily
MGSAADADPAARAVVEQVRAMRVLCYAASNQDNRRAAFLKNLPWLQAIFDETFFSCDLGVMKPDARYFAIIERHAKLPPEQLLFVDDRLENVEGARQCGWAAEVCNGAVDLRRIMDRYLFNPGKQGACE